MVNKGRVLRYDLDEQSESTTDPVLRLFLDEFTFAEPGVRVAMMRLATMRKAGIHPTVEQARDFIHICIQGEKTRREKVVRETGNHDHPHLLHPARRPHQDRHHGEPAEPCR